MRHYSALRNVQANRDFDCRGRFNTNKRASFCQHPVPVFSFHLPISFSRTLANVSRAHRRRCMLQEHGGANFREILLLAAQRSTLSGTAPGPLIPNATVHFFPSYSYQLVKGAERPSSPSVGCGTAYLSVQVYKTAPSRP